MEPRFTALELFAPRIDHVIDVDAILARVPARAATKGMTIKAALDRLRTRPEFGDWTDERVLASAGVPTVRPGLLEDIPWSTYVRVAVFVARMIRPDNVCVGLREVGNNMYGAFGETLIGRMLFGTLGRNFGRVLMMGPNAWRVCDNFGEVSAEQLPGQHVRFHFKDYPVEIVETIFLGAIEGGCIWLDVEAEFQIATPSERHTVIDVVWRYA